MKTSKILVSLFVIFFALTSTLMAKSSYSGKMNINKASVFELEKLPFIGKSKAEKIAKHRESGQFTKIEDIMDVKGIGQGIFSKIKGYITVQGNSDFKVVEEE